MRVEKDITVNAPVEKVYGMWTDFENFPSFMDNVESVRKTGDRTYHWKAKVGPFEKEWDAEVQGLVENRTVTWRSTSGAENAGAVTLSERGNITNMHVVIEYDPTWVEAIGDAVTGTLARSVEEDLARFKRLAEGRDPKLADASDAHPARGQSGSTGRDPFYDKERNDS
jgi:uncharacterized membrane protein